MKDLNYVIGRLQGLNELVRILKDLVDKKEDQTPEIVSVITDHVAEQLNSILTEFDEIDLPDEHREKLQAIKDKHQKNLSSESDLLAEEKPKEPPEEESEEGAGEGAEEGAKEEKPSGKETVEKHEKTVDDLLKDLESLKS